MVGRDQERLVVRFFLERAVRADGAGAARRAGDRQDDALGGGDRPRGGGRAAGARRPAERRRGPALLRRADRPVRGPGARRRCPRRNGPRSRSRSCGASRTAPPEPHAIGLALRGALAAAAPVLVAIDDVQSLDAPSAEALAFAARRLRRRAGRVPARPAAMGGSPLERRVGASARSRRSTSARWRRVSCGRWSRTGSAWSCR